MPKTTKNKLIDNKNFIIFVIIIAVIFAVIFIIRLLSGEDNWICQNNEWVKHGQPKSLKPTENCGLIPKTIINNPNANTNINEEKNIIVAEPKEGETVTLPFTVKGKARVFENIINFRIKEKSGIILYEGYTTAQSPDIGQFGNFEKIINFVLKNSSGQNITLEAYWSSPKNGSDSDLVSIPLKLDLTGSKQLKVFFNNNKLDPEITCNKVFSVDRTTYETVAPARLALEILISGPTSPESENGYFTNINQGVKINSLSIDQGVAKADFDETLETKVGGSCKISAIRSQITETLKQFSTVNEVIISIDGQTEDILQP